MNERDEKEIKGSNWTSFFLVTGICLLIFSGLMRLLDGVPIRIFIIIGLGATGLGVLSFLNEWVTKKFMSSKSNISQQQNQSA
jgi:ABC-type uncharacterized transport system permease subunit